MALAEQLHFVRCGAQSSLLLLMLVGFVQLCLLGLISKNL
jgi:hypothetical protein